MTMPVRVLSVAVLLGAALSACGGGSGSGSGGSGPTVAAGFYPLAWVSERVGGDAVDVSNLTTAGGEPHDLELSIQQTAQLSDADLVVHESGLQPAVDAAVEDNASGEVVDAAEVVELRPATDHDAEHDHDADGGHEDGHEDGHEESGEDEHEHGETDPHFWLDPLLMADLADAVADQLAEVDPDGAEGYRERAAALREDLTALDEEYAEGLAACERDTVVVSHDAFGYLDRYGLHMEPILGLSPDAEPTPATLVELRELIEDEGITTVFSETLVSAQTSEALAREAGVETDVLDPIEGLSDDTAGEDYLSLMRTNLAALQEAGGC